MKHKLGSFLIVLNLMLSTILGTDVVLNTETAGRPCASAGQCCFHSLNLLTNPENPGAKPEHFREAALSLLYLKILGEGADEKIRQRDERVATLLARYAEHPKATPRDILCAVRLMGKLNNPEPYKLKAQDLLERAAFHLKATPDLILEVGNEMNKIAPANKESIAAIYKHAGDHELAKPFVINWAADKLLKDLGPGFEGQAADLYFLAIVKSEPGESTISYSLNRLLGLGEKYEKIVANIYKSYVEYSGASPDELRRVADKLMMLDYNSHPIAAAIYYNSAFLRQATGFDVSKAIDALKKLRGYQHLVTELRKIYYSKCK